MMRLKGHPRERVSFLLDFNNRSCKGLQCDLWIIPLIFYGGIIELRIIHVKE